VRHVEDRAGHDRRYAVNCDKARRLGWEPRVTFEQGLPATVQWYRENEAWWRPLRGADFVDYYRRQYAQR